MLVAIQKSQGSAAAVSLVKTSVGADAGEAITDILEQMRSREAAEHAAAVAYWSRASVLSRWITIAGTIFNMLLVGVAARLVYMDMRRRNAQTAELREQKLKLEREAEERNRELVELSTHLQSVAEREKASLARELHDELGGLLVGARMDISWAEQHLAQDDPSMQAATAARSAEPLGGRGSQAAHHRGAAPDAVGQCGIVRRVALAIEGDLRPRRAADASSHFPARSRGSPPKRPSRCFASRRKPLRTSSSIRRPRPWTSL